jgi:hypothetical protein
VPVTSILALISNSALVATAAQGLLYGLANNCYYNKWLQTVTYNAPTSVTFSTNTVISTAVLIAQNITISSGVTVTCGTTTCYFIAQAFNNQGTVVSPYGAAGGNAYNGTFGGGTGGTGGGGVVIIAYTAAVGTINMNGANGQNSVVSQTGYLGPAFRGGAGVFAVVSGVTVPSGGTAGAIYAGLYGFGEPNGGGGGYGGASHGGNGGSATVYSFPNGNALITYLMQGASDWWLSNVIGKAPPSVTPLLFIYGSGGGGGGNSASGYVGGGGGGGGGGEAIIYGYDVIAGTIDVAGGAGGSSTGVGGIAGGGGGGGVALVFYGPGGLSYTMSYSLAGGAGGVGSTSSYNGQPGGTGSYLATSVTVNG